MIRRLAPYLIAAVLAAGGVWYVMALTAERDDLRETVAAQAREIAVQREISEQARLARAVEAAHREREAKRAAELQQGIEALLTGDFTDADTRIDPRIGAWLDCLRRAEGGDTAGCAGGLDGPADARPDQ